MTYGDPKLLVHLAFWILQYYVGEDMRLTSSSCWLIADFVNTSSEDVVKVKWHFWLSFVVDYSPESAKVNGA